MWKKCLECLDGNNCENGSAGTFDWQQALQQPDAVNGGNGFAGYTDWRLPNIRELLTLLEDQCTDPAINPTRFPNTSSLQAWSGSPAAGNNLSAWYVDFKTGASSIDDRNKTFVVRLVRGGY